MSLELGSWEASFFSFSLKIHHFQVSGRNRTNKYLSRWFVCLKNIILIEAQILNEWIFFPLNLM